MRPDFANVQGIVRYGYGRCDAARFVPLLITDEARARTWLRDLLSGARGLALRDARLAPERDDVCINLALSYDGLRLVGLEAPLLAQFSREFQEGMAGDPQRSRALGDRGESAPERWRWGGPQNPTPHLMLMIYGGQTIVAEVYERCLAHAAIHGLEEVLPLPPSLNLPGFKEHFGFTDGIAQPQVEGLDDPSDERWHGNRVRLGEVLLGYPNEYGQFTERPLLSAESERQNLLPLDLGGSGKHDFARDGSYLVFRQLRQDVSAWWRSMDEATGGRGREHPGSMVTLASKMMGRWPDGSSLATSRDGPAPAGRADQDAFDYARDPDGFGCPLGAHVRRANPRGSMPPERGGPSTTDQALAIGRRHRIVRRGRSFGSPLDASMSPERLLAADAGDEERGLHFMCLGANIARQFEFLQQAWLLNPKFQGLCDDVDPVLGAHGSDGATGFSVPALPLRKRYQTMSRFVSMLGGAYLFLPSFAALRYLAGRS